MENLKNFEKLAEALVEKFKNCGYNNADKDSAVTNNSLQEGDVFTLIGADIVDNDTMKELKMLRLVFTTSNGCSIGTRNFKGLDVNGVTIGRTITDACAFLEASEGVAFKVVEIDNEKVKPKDGQEFSPYTKKNYILEIVEE